jgi:branched-chain amino acid transport system permease protein
LVWLKAGQVPGTVWLILVMAVTAGVLEAAAVLRDKNHRALLRIVEIFGVLPCALAAASAWAASNALPLLAQCVLTMAIVTPIGPLLYRLVYRPISDESVLVLLIVSVGAHFMLAGMGLWFFGGEGYRTPAFWDAEMDVED